MDRRLSNLRTEVKLKIIRKKLSVYMLSALFGVPSYEVLKSMRQAVLVTFVVTTVMMFGLIQP